MKAQIKIGNIPEVSFRTHNFSSHLFDENNCWVFCIAWRNICVKKDIDGKSFENETNYDSYCQVYVNKIEWSKYPESQYFIEISRLIDYCQAELNIINV